MKGRNQTLDLMRFFAALWVAFFHFNRPVEYIDNPYRNLMKLGYVGVPIFFVISGYCIIFSAERSKSWKDFLIRRFFRIYPPYLMSLFVTLLSIGLYKIITGYNSVAYLPKTPYSIFCTFSLLTLPLTPVTPINWVYWTLSLEAVYYILSGIALVWPERLRLIFFVLLSVAGLLLPAGDKGWLSIFKYLPIFSLGIALYYIQKRQQIMWALLLIGLNVWQLVNTFLWGDLPGYFYAALAAMVLILVSFKYKLKKNWLSTTGDYSYSVYLLHVPIAIYLMNLLKTPYIQKHIITNILFDVCCYLITLGFAYLAFKWIELPSINFGKAVAQKVISKQPQPLINDAPAANHK